MQLEDVQGLLNTLFKLFVNEDINDSYFNNVEKEINSFYEDEKIRHKYSSVYSFILDKYKDNSDILPQFIESLTYIEQRGNLTPVAKNKFLKLLDHIELENLKIVDLYRLDAFTDFSNRLDKEVKNLSVKEIEMGEKLKYTEMELKTIKIDFIGILSSILSLFTIFGLNSSIISVLIEKSNVSVCSKVLIFIGANITLGVSIFLVLYFIKCMFYEYKK